MKCPECERLGERSKLYMPDCYSSTAMAGTRTYYDEDGHRHHHEVNSSHGWARCSNGHRLSVRASDKCPAPDCDYGSPMTMTSDTDLDSLLPGTIVRFGNGVAGQKRDGVDWFMANDEDYEFSGEMIAMNAAYALPAIVLWEPGDEK